MFDLHAHVLPALDDGPQTLEEAISTCSVLAQEGVTDIVATPHFDTRHVRISAAEVQQRATALQRVVRQVGVSVRIWAGHEVHTDVEIERHLAEGMVATINDGPYLLVECSQLSLPQGMPLLIARLRRSGYIPILAHVERLMPVRQDVRVLLPLLEAGALFQVTASSLVGAYGPGVQHAAEHLLRCNLVHVLASGTHAAGQRPPRFAEGMRAAEALVGHRRVWDMVIGVPQAIVRGAPVEVPPAHSVRPHGTWPPAPGSH